MLSYRFVRPLATALAAAVVLAGLAPFLPAASPGRIETRAAETTRAVDRVQDFALPDGTTHLAIHWPGNDDAQVTAAFSADGTAFGEPVAVAHDELDAARGNGETYGAVMIADGMRAVRVTTDRPLAALSVLSLDTAGAGVELPGAGARATAATTIPTIISRAGWGADESIRFDNAGDELWSREYFPLQKLVVHHTAGRNADPNPAATVRAIYYYHAVTRGWGDIGYQYLIDEAGRVYEGRHSRDYWRNQTPTADDAGGLVVTGGHAKFHNAGSMGISLMGTFTSQAPTAPARASLVRLLAWASATHGIDPLGNETYLNPVTGLTRSTPNITGHRDYQATSCPGGALYAMLPAIRRDVAAAINRWPGEVYNPGRTITFAAGTWVGHRFSANGTIIASKPYTLTKPSGAPTDQRATVPNQPGSWYSITAGVWAGYWIREATGMSISGVPPAPPPFEVFQTARPLTLAAGAHVGRRFSTYGVVVASKTYEAASGAVVWTTQRSGIPRQGGWWYLITTGPLEGYWIPASGTTLGAPPPPPPVAVATYDPPRYLTLAPGTYTGKRFSAYGVVAATKTHTLGVSSTVPVRVKSAITNQLGTWYLVTAGVWEDYWIQESPGTTLAP